MFEKGQILICTSGKYYGHKVVITDIHISHHPLLYSVNVMSNGKDMALYETELKTAYRFDLDNLRM